jgi:hypothetical protein
VPDPSLDFVIFAIPSFPFPMRFMEIGWSIKLVLMPGPKKIETRGASYCGGSLHRAMSFNYCGKYLCLEYPLVCIGCLKKYLRDLASREKPFSKDRPGYDRCLLKHAHPNTWVMPCREPKRTCGGYWTVSGVNRHAAANTAKGFFIRQINQNNRATPTLRVYTVIHPPCLLQLVRVQD